MKTAEPVDKEFDELEAEVRRILDSEAGSDDVESLAALLERLSSGGGHYLAERRARCLVDVGYRYYLQGKSTLLALKPANLAVALAQQSNDKALQRMALQLQGIILSACGLVGAAARAFTAAVALAENMGDKVAEAATWSNLGAAFLEAGLYEDAFKFLERASWLPVDDEPGRRIKTAALQNQAMCRLNMQDCAGGLPLIEKAVALHDVNVPGGALNAVLAEGTYVRLLLAVGRVREAITRADLAEKFGRLAHSERAHVSVLCSKGLVKAYCGDPDAGLTMIAEALKRGRELSRLPREVLVVQIQTAELAGQHQQALEAHKELSSDVRAATIEAAIAFESEKQARVASAEFDGLKVRFRAQLAATSRPPSTGSRNATSPGAEWRD